MSFEVEVNGQSLKVLVPRAGEIGDISAVERGSGFSHDPIVAMQVRPNDSESQSFISAEGYLITGAVIGVYALAGMLTARAARNAYASAVSRTDRVKDRLQRAHEQTALDARALGASEEEAEYVTSNILRQTKTVNQIALALAETAPITRWWRPIQSYRSWGNYSKSGMEVDRSPSRLADIVGNRLAGHSVLFVNEPLPKTIRVVGRAVNNAGEEISVRESVRSRIYQEPNGRQRIFGLAVMESALSQYFEQPEFDTALAQLAERYNFVMENTKLEVQYQDLYVNNFGHGAYSELAMNNEALSNKIREILGVPRERSAAAHTWIEMQQELFEGWGATVMDREDVVELAEQLLLSKNDFFGASIVNGMSESAKLKLKKIIDCRDLEQAIQDMIGLKHELLSQGPNKTDDASQAKV